MTFLKHTKATKMLESKSLGDSYKKRDKTSACQIAQGK